MNANVRCTSVFVALTLTGSLSLAERITTGSLIREMVDLRRLADFPDPAFRTVQFSSYDRRSNLPDGPDWFANSDGFGREPIPGFQAVLKEPDDDQSIGEYLICDVQRPGAIVRTWTAAINGSIRVYLDGAAEPIYDGSAQDFLFNPYHAFAEAAGIQDAVLDGTYRQRQAAYCPIPFGQGCRIVWVGDLQRVHFYQIQLRLYEPGAEVVTFQPQDLETYEYPVRDVARILSDPNANWKHASKLEPAVISATVAAGTLQEVLLFEGSQALERLSLKVVAQDIDKALRQTILHVMCDGHPWGQVQAPLGDFFGAAPGINPFNSVPFTVSPDGMMTCRYVMPFAKSLKVLIDNRGAQAVTVSGSALPMEYDWNDKTSMHFRARWRVDHGLVASNRKVQDLPFLLANGRGVYVGTALMLLNPTPVPTPGGGWWGEGDEKIFIDDDSVPSTFGTGSEDYFNYAWSSPDIFLFPYCGQPRNDGPGNRGFVTNQRWQIIDALPFQRRIAFYMELYSHERLPGVSYARIGYHYARPGAYDDHVQITDEDVRHLELPANWQPAPRGQVRDAVFYQAEELARPGATTSFAEGRLWAGGRLLVWHPRDEGDRLVLSVPILEDGKHVLNLGFALTREGGKISVELDGDKIGIGGDEGVLDLHVPHRVLHRQYKSSEVDLRKGEHALTISFEGPSAGNQSAAIGIDYLAVQQSK